MKSCKIRRKLLTLRHGRVNLCFAPRFRRQFQIRPCIPKYDLITSQLLNVTLYDKKKSCIFTNAMSNGRNVYSFSFKKGKKKLFFPFK